MLETYPSVTILFSQVTNFTQLVEEATPMQLIRMLNEIFAFFDMLCRKHGLEKVREFF